MKIIHLNQSDKEGGASIASYRLHKSLLKHAVKSEFWVDKKISNDATVKIKLNFFERYARRMSNWCSKQIVKAIGIKQKSYFNLGIFGSSWIHYLNNSDADIVHLHWLGNEILSLRQIHKINKPCLVTLHDEWILGYGFHIYSHQAYFKKETLIYKLITNYLRKIREKYHDKNLYLIAPSKFMSNLIKNNHLYKKNKYKTIGHSISQDNWIPVSREIAKREIGVPIKNYSILFSSFGGEKDLNKGFKDFSYAVKEFQNINPNIDISLIFVGDFNDSSIKDIGIPSISMGILKNKHDLINTYCASDVVLVPSKYESFGLVAQEACILGIPVVAYENSGIADFIFHKENGYLAKNFDHGDLANGLNFWYKNNSKKLIDQNRNILMKYSEERIVQEYINVYKELLSKRTKS